MFFKSIKEKIHTLGHASKQNSDDLLAQIHVHREEFAGHLDAALTLAETMQDADDKSELKNQVRQALKHSKALDHYAYYLLPARRLLQLHNKLDQLSADDLGRVAAVIRKKLELQTAFLNDTIHRQKIPAAALWLRDLDNELASLLASRAEKVLVRANNTAVGMLANGAHLAIQPIGWTAEQVAKPLMASNHWITGGRVSRVLGTTIHGFLSRSSLARTGFETSWGVRFIVPGTVGFFGNAGPWIMFYTGQIRDYQAMAVPFRVNPGATLATDIATFTINRPGFGAGTATPIASGYVDSARSKLLIGRDGVLYVRVGIWEGRGAYFTISAFIPLLPWMHITWNASIFSPGWEPLVRWSHPMTIWVRGQADWIWRKLSSLRPGARRR